MFRALLCPSSGARDSNVDCHVRRFVLVVRAAGYSLQQDLTSNLQHTKNETTNAGNQHYSRELLMMGITVPETC